MAKGMTKTQLIRFMAEKLEINNKQSALFFSTMAETAVKETKKNGEFTIPGIGKLVKAERKARIGRNPADRRGHQDQGQDRGQVPHRQGRQGHHRAGEGKGFREGTGRARREESHVQEGRRRRLAPHA